MKNYVRGTLINLFYHNGTAWKAFAYSTSNSLETSAETASIASKDMAQHPHTEINNQTFSMSGEYLFSPEDAKIIMAMMASAKVYTFAFAQTAETNYADGLVSETGVGDQESWSPGTDFVKYGDCNITSASITAANNEVATISLTLTGSGALMDAVPTNINSYTATETGTDTE